VSALRRGSGSSALTPGSPSLPGVAAAATIPESYGGRGDAYPHRPRVEPQPHLRSSSRRRAKRPSLSGACSAALVFRSTLRTVIGSGRVRSSQAAAAHGCARSRLSEFQTAAKRAVIPRTSPTRSPATPSAIAARNRGGAALQIAVTWARVGISSGGTLCSSGLRTGTDGHVARDASGVVRGSHDREQVGHRQRGRLRGVALREPGPRTLDRQLADAGQRRARRQHSPQSVRSRAVNPSRVVSFQS
jgi:hypothetical protein